MYRTDNIIRRSTESANESVTLRIATSAVYVFLTKKNIQIKFYFVLKVRGEFIENQHKGFFFFINKFSDELKPMTISRLKHSKIFKKKIGTWLFLSYQNTLYLLIIMYYNM